MDRMHITISDDVSRIINYMSRGGGKNQPYNRLVDLTDTFGHRLSGSQALEDAIGTVMFYFWYYQ